MHLNPVSRTVHGIRMARYTIRPSTVPRDILSTRMCTVVQMASGSTFIQPTLTTLSPNFGRHIAGCNAQPNLPGVYDLPLPARCKFTIFTEESHVKEWAVALSCPGIDLMRVYPWPPVQPWDESPSWEEGAPNASTNEATGAYSIALLSIATSRSKDPLSSQSRASAHSVWE